MARQYEFRPAKAAQRRMIVDACRRLTAVAPLEDYQYVGFGGLEFIDFVEFHRALGIQAMTSIERSVDINRLEFNKPYKWIELLIGEARDMLSQVDWNNLSIIWLDYTDLLTRDILRDVEYVVRSCLPGSIVIVTVNGASTGIPLPLRLPKLRENLGDAVSGALTDSDMTGWGPAREQRRILNERAHTTAREAHNGSFRQLFNFEYADDAKMLTWGGVVLSPALARTVDGCRFEDLSFIRSEVDSFEIKVPFLTDREMAYLESELGGSNAARPSLKGVDRSDIRAFADMYRWRVGNR